jgi:predicted nucleic acid-binding protein
MARIVADTSALVSVGTVAETTPNPLDLLLRSSELLLPEQVVDELADTAAYDDVSGVAARAVLDRRGGFEVRAVELDETFPLDDGENAAVSLANDVRATQLLCDEFNQLALVHASLVDTRLVTTPTLLTALVRNGVLSPAAAERFLEEMTHARSWSGNAYVERANETLRRYREGR